MAKVCPECGREFGNSSVRCPICKCDLVEIGEKGSNGVITRSTQQPSVQRRPAQSQQVPQRPAQNTQYRQQVPHNQNYANPNMNVYQNRVPENGGTNIIIQQSLGQQSQPPAYAPAPTYGKKYVNKVAYCLLAFFLGGLGIHKFYSGRIAAGVLYILFCWTAIPEIIAFVEFIIGLCKPADEYGMIWI